MTDPIQALADRMAALPSVTDVAVKSSSVITYKHRDLLAGICYCILELLPDGRIFDSVRSIGSTINEYHVSSDEFINWLEQ